MTNTEPFELRCAPDFVQADYCICCNFELSDYVKKRNSSICIACLNQIIKENKPKLSFLETNEPINFDMFNQEKSKRHNHRVSEYAKFFKTGHWH